MSKTNEVLRKKIYPIFLGCDKNRVDLEHILFSLTENGYILSQDINDTDIILVQTCAFILPARKEAIDNILMALDYKEKGLVAKVVVSGCLPQKSLNELKESLPNVDAFITVKNYDKTVSILDSCYNYTRKIAQVKKTQRKISTPSHYAYLKISDGCNNCCSYCTIPRIRGMYKSIPFEEIIKEANFLVDNGVKEIILVAQDLTRYGIDLYDKYRLKDLLTELSKIPKLRWIRLLYCYPELVDDELLQLIKTNTKICKYIDIPLQHIDDKILKNMNRRNTEEETRNLINKINDNYPEIAIRTTFIVGLPTETRSNFIKLCKFIKDIKFLNVGFFKYSREEGTRAFFMKPQVNELVKKMRFKKLEKLQTKINIDNSHILVGNNIEVMIDEFDEENGNYIAHSQWFAPEVDFIIKIDYNEKVEIGNIYTANIYQYEQISYTYMGRLL